MVTLIQMYIYLFIGCILVYTRSQNARKLSDDKILVGRSRGILKIPVKFVKNGQFPPEYEVPVDTTICINMP